jgi:hypothetical protein
MANGLKYWLSADSKDGNASQLEIVILGSFLALQTIAFFYLFVLIWPDEAFRAANGVVPNAPLGLGLEGRVILMSALAGAIGSSAHACTSFADYVGNGKLGRPWIWWILMRAPVGTLLGLLVFLLLAGGLIAIYAKTPPSLKDYNMFGVAGFSALAGMFSKQATDKLAEVFSTLFRSDVDRSRQDKLDGRGPAISAVTPASIKSGTAAPKLTVKGANFTAECAVEVDGKPRKTTYGSPTQLSVELDAQDVAKAGEIELVVKNPKTGGTSAAVKLKVT